MIPVEGARYVAHWRPANVTWWLVPIARHVVRFPVLAETRRSDSCGSRCTTS